MDLAKSSNHILVISAKETFISKALQRNLRDAGYTVSYSPAQVESISTFNDTANIYILYMDEDMEKVGFPIKEKLFAQEVYYCPHVSAKDYADGWYDKLEVIQGTRNTYYAGEIISFGDMEDTCAASKDIIGRFF